METNKKYNVNWELLASLLSGNATDTEKSEVQAWLAKSEKNKEMFRTAEKLWAASKNAQMADIDVDVAWQNINSKSHITVKNRTKYLLTKSYEYSLRVAAILLIGLLSWYLTSNINYQKISNSGSSVCVLSLKDGSQVTLNKDSKLKYPKFFKGRSREVYLEGEAFFNITKNPQKPFIIKTATTQIKVVGTSFSVNTNCNGNVEVIVNSGIVSFKDDNSKQQIILHKNDKGLFVKTKGEMEKSLNTDPNYLSWKTRKFVFDETRLKDIFDKIEKVYSIRIIARDSIIYNCKMTATFDNLSSDDIIKSIELAFRYKSSKSDNIYTIVGNDCIKKQ
jgi:transmembrane sensor